MLGLEYLFDFLASVTRVDTDGDAAHITPEPFEQRWTQYLVAAPPHRFADQYGDRHPRAGRGLFEASL